MIESFVHYDDEDNEGVFSLLQLNLFQKSTPKFLFRPTDNFVAFEEPAASLG